MFSSRPSDRVYIALYCFSNLAIGAILGAIGPLIPYLAKERSKEQTQYSFLFSARTIGSLACFVLLRYIQKIDQRHYQHKMIAFASGVFALFLLIFVWWESTFFQFVSFFVYGGGHYVIFTLVSICLIEVAHEKTGEYMPLTYAFFGTGALLAPFIVREMQIKACYAFFLLFVVLTVAYLCVPTPTHVQLSEQQTPKKKYKDVPYKLEVLFGLVFFSQMGVEITAPGWLPTFAVLTGAFDVEVAVFSGTLFWGMVTIFRFLATAIKIPCSDKIVILANSMFTVSFITLFLDLAHSYKLVTVVGSLGFGFSCSAVLSLLLSVPVEFGFKLKPQQISNMMVLMSLSPIVVTSSVGWLMQKDVDILIYSLFMVSGAIWACIHLLIRNIKAEGSQKENSMMELMQK